ncbi:acetylglutamate kinase [Vallitalea okinawensis]|uniref:acetylglutamate kinase n=1 Tax=Vallitalea okinawensis TaxID=2078660 RepID=UPI000CFB2C84|nr:acetylglutamate kinase [Vallitalea okinawensis]
MEKYISKAKVLIEALPYFKAFNDKIVVIKYGGSAMIDDHLKSAVLEDIVLMRYIGMKPVIVHGGGKEISTTLERLGKKTDFIQGYRVTDEETMEIAEMVLSGKVGKNIVRHLHVHGVNAVGISGKDGGILKCCKKSIGDIDVGLVGEVTDVNPKLIMTLLEDGFIPVISPIGINKEGETFNVNADQAASSIAGAVNAEKLVFLTDVPGVLGDKNDLSSLMSTLSLREIQLLIKEKQVEGGMIPKLQCCYQAVIDGVKKVHILDGRVEHSLLLEMFTNDGIGTMVEGGEQDEKMVI